MIQRIKQAVERIREISEKKPIRVISHYGTDGITAAAIIARTLQRWNKKFSLDIVKELDENIIAALPEDHVLFFLDLASGSLNYLAQKKTEIFILNHHKIVQDIPPNVFMINTLFEHYEPISGAGIAYLFAKTLSPQNTDLAHLAIIGVVEDLLEKDLEKVYEEILKDSETVIKKGLLVYPSTRPLDKALEYSSNPYIPGVSGSFKGALELLREAKILKVNGRFKSLHELTEEEMRALVTAVLLRCSHEKNQQNLIGNIFLVKFFNKLEDARELSALINACSHMDAPNVALGFCLGNKRLREEAEKIYIEYKQHIVAALRYITESEKISGKDYAIINARTNIKDTIIGTVASIISHSPAYTEGTIIVALAYNDDKIKVSARIVGRTGRNVQEVLSQVVVPLGGEVGGHSAAAGCLISREQEAQFLEELQKVLETSRIV